MVVGKEEGEREPKVDWRGEEERGKEEPKANGWVVMGRLWVDKGERWSVETEGLAMMVAKREIG